MAYDPHQGWRLGCSVPWRPQQRGMGLGTESPWVPLATAPLELRTYVGNEELQSFLMSITVPPALGPGPCLDGAAPNPNPATRGDGRPQRSWAGCFFFPADPPPPGGGGGRRF